MKNNFLKNAKSIVWEYFSRNPEESYKPQKVINSISIIFLPILSYYLW